MPRFGSIELCNCLSRLGFISHHQSGTSHVKYDVPKGLKIPVGIYPFIIVIMGRKSYDPNTRSRYISQIKRLGFAKKEIAKCFSRK